MFTTVRDVADEIVNRMAGWGIDVSMDDAMEIARLSGRRYEAIDDEELTFVLWLWLGETHGITTANDLIGYDAQRVRWGQAAELAGLVAAGWPDIARTPSGRDYLWRISEDHIDDVCGVRDTTLDELAAIAGDVQRAISETGDEDDPDVTEEEIPAALERVTGIITGAGGSGVLLSDAVVDNGMTLMAMPPGSASGSRRAAMFPASPEMSPS